MDKKITLSLIGIIIIISVGLLHNTDKKETPDVLQLGAILSLSGNGAPYGEPARDGLLLATEEINQSGGINSKKVEVLFEDSEFNPKKAVDAYQKLKSQGINHFITNGSSVSVAVSNPVRTDENIMFEVGAVTPTYRDNNSNTCRAALTADAAGKKLGEFIATKLQSKGVAFLTLADEYGNAMKDNTIATLKEYNISIVATESFLREDSDYRTQITKLKAQQNFFDTLFVIPIGAQAEKMFRQIKELGLTDVHMVSDNWSIVNPNLTNLSLVEDIYFSDYDWSLEAQEADSKKTQDFKQKFEKRFGYKPHVIAATTFDSVYVLADAIHETNSLEPNNLSNYITNRMTEYSGAGGSISFDKDCEGARDVVIRQVKEEIFKTIE